MSNPDQRRGAVAAGGATRRRRPWWVWLLLAIAAVLVVLAILLLTSRCGTDAGPPPGPSGAGAGGAPAASGAPSPGALPPGAPSGAPGSTDAGGEPGGAGGAGAAGDAAAVSARIQEILDATPVTFLPDQAELTTAGAESLDEVARELGAAPAVRVTVTGYAAPVSQGMGPAAQALSDQRAATVAQRLTADGIDPARIQTHGAADTNPRASTAASRRAEITVS